MELLDSVREGNDLGGAHEGEVKGIEVDHDILALTMQKIKRTVLKVKLFYICTDEKSFVTHRANFGH